MLVEVRTKSGKTYVRTIDVSVEAGLRFVPEEKRQLTCMYFGKVWLTLRAPSR